MKELICSFKLYLQCSYFCTLLNYRARSSVALTESPDLRSSLFDFKYLYQHFMNPFNLDSTIKYFYLI